ncbi:MAG: amidohydrolase [Treponema sp.]|nr:amidohydrolase [Treponema sp.]
MAKTLIEEVRDDHQYVVELRRHFHRYPEVAKEEFKTAERIEKELDAIGVNHRRAGETGVYAEIQGEKADGGSPARTIVLRADIDALPIQETHECSYTSTIPGRMHACGHDAHTAALLGAARMLAAHRKDFAGTVRLCFQQGEEIGYGARIFVDSGLLAGAGRTFGIHAASNIPAGSVAIVPGPNNASVDWFRITVCGHPAHVSTPQLGADAVYIASQIVVALQALVTRRTSPMDNVLIGVGKISAGDAYNIVAQRAELEGTIRVLTPELRAQMKSQLQALAENIAASFGGSATLEWKDFTSPLINDAEASAEAQQTAARLFGADKVITSRQPALGGDDFAEFILAVPGAYAYVGTGNSARKETLVAHHDSMFDIDEDSLIVAVALYAQYALDYLNGNCSGGRS